MAAETAFKVQDGATYRLRRLDAQQAADLGCAGAGAILISNADSRRHIVGSLAELTGKLVRVPGWTQRRGTLADFTPHDSQDVLRGWIGE